MLEGCQCAFSFYTSTTCKVYKKWIPENLCQLFIRTLLPGFLKCNTNTAIQSRSTKKILPEESYQSSISSIPFIPFLVQKFKKKKKEKNKDPVPVQFSLSCQLIPKPLIPSRFRYKVYTYIYIYKAWRRRHIDTFARENFSDPDFPSVSNWKGRQVPAQVEK